MSSENVDSLVLSKWVCVCGHVCMCVGGGVFVCVCGHVCICVGDVYAVLWGEVFLYVCGGCGCLYMCIDSDVKNLVS